MFKSQIVAAALTATIITGCNEAAPPTPEARPVRTVTVHDGAQGEIVSLTGQVRAKDQTSVAFRLDGRMIERRVNVGDRLTAGQVVASLDPKIQENALRSAEANLASSSSAADPGAPHLFAAAGTLEGRLDHTGQFRRRPAEAPDCPGPGRLCRGASTDRARAAELHGPVGRCAGRGHVGRRRTGRSGACWTNGCAGRARGRTRRRLRRT